MSHYKLPEAIELFRHYRNEVRHEMDLMLARLNALLVSQSFLVIAYATGMSISNDRWGHVLSLLLPPFLALLGFVLAWEGRSGIYAARTALRRWQKRLSALVAENPGLSDWADSNGYEVKRTRRAGELFAVRPPVIFMISWVWLAFFPFIMHFLSVG